MKLRVGDVIEDRRWLPTMRYVGIVTEIRCGGFAHAVITALDRNYKVISIEMDRCIDIDDDENGIILLTPAPRLEIVSSGPMASTVDKCSPRCDYEYPESSYGACDGLPCGLPATKQVGEFSACAKHERQMENV